MSELITYQHSMHVGIDVGQVNDPTALAVVERLRPVPDLRHLPAALHERAIKEAAETPKRLNLRYLERLPLGVLYPQQVEIIMARLFAPQLRGAHVYLDATGVGRPVSQMLRRAGARNLQGITITSAQSPARETADGWNVGKAELVNGVLIAMQVGELRLGRQVEHVDVLVKEMRDFRSRQNPTTGNISFNAREGQHDDLILAVSYAVFGAQRPTPVTSLDVRFAA